MWPHYFGTPFFALAAASTWALGLLLIKQENPHFWLILAFALSGLVTGLIRPEGVILASLMLLVRCYHARTSRIPFRSSLPLALSFLLLGGAYFLWRWNYFGYPLPNPFYKKGDSGLHWDSFNNSLLNTLRLCLPLAIIALFLVFVHTRPRKQTIAYLIPILGFASAFVLISDEMNYGARFQYALLPIALMSWIPLVRGLNFSWPHQLSGQGKKRVLHRINCFVCESHLLLVVSELFPHILSADLYDGRMKMMAVMTWARLLAEYRDKGYVIATTEAGLLPYYSGWDAIDTWGLNDQFIAHNGGLTAEYLDQYKPHIIMFHDYYSPLVPPKLTDANLAQRWFSMTITMKEYAEANGYVLAAVFGDSPYDTHYYYVRSDFEDSKRLIEQISKMKKYYYPTTGKKSINYADLSEP